VTAWRDSKENNMWPFYSQVTLDVLLRAKRWQIPGTFGLFSSDDGTIRVWFDDTNNSKVYKLGNAGLKLIDDNAKILVK
jgi:hypothetical protein